MHGRFVDEIHGARSTIIIDGCSAIERVLFRVRNRSHLIS